MAIVNLEPRGPTVEVRPGKRHHGGNAADVLEENSDRGFMLPLCISEHFYLDKFPIGVSS